MKKRSNRGVLNGTNDRMLNGPPSEGGVFQESLKRCSQPLSVIFLIPLWLSAVNRPIRFLRGRKAGTRATPPKSGGACDPDSGAVFHASIPAPWGRSRPHLSLREGSEQPPRSGAESTETDL